VVDGCSLASSAAVAAWKLEIKEMINVTTQQFENILISQM
jgi:hypothetical protein